jgi:hypothetical protein
LLSEIQQTKKIRIRKAGTQDVFFSCFPIFLIQVPIPISCSS